MRRTLLLLTFVVPLLIVAGCAKDLNPFRNVVIDWVDFVKLEGRTYTGLYQAVLADPELATDRIVGEVRFNVSRNVTNPNYRTKNGDAAFLQEGTPLFAIQGLDPERYIAAKDESAVGGYKVYYNAEGEEGGRRSFHFRDMAQPNIVRIDVYEGYAGTRRVAAHEGEAVQAVLELLNRSEERPDYRSSTSEGDPEAYRLVFHDGGPIANMYAIYRDDAAYYWHPWDTNVLDDAIGEYVAPSASNP